MSYKKYAKILKQADPDDAANDRMQDIVKEAESLNEIMEELKKEREELSQRGDLFAMDMQKVIEEIMTDPVYITEYIVGDLTRKLSDIAGNDVLKSAYHDRSTLYWKFVGKLQQHLDQIGKLGPEIAMKTRNKILAQPMSLIEKILEEAKKDEL